MSACMTFYRRFRSVYSTMACRTDALGKNCAAGTQPQPANRSPPFCARAVPRSGCAGFALDYLEARHAETLAPVASATDGPIRLLVAARIGSTRLIDNVGV